jgi:hypothetical protein
MTLANSLCDFFGLSVMASSLLRQQRTRREAVHKLFLSSSSAR